MKRTCIPFIGLDGCNLKNKYGGILLISVRRDPNDEYFPITFRVVENETKDSWRWLIKFLLEDIGEYRWCVISSHKKVCLTVYDYCFIPHFSLLKNCGIV